MSQPSSKELYLRLLGYLKPYRLPFALSLLATAGLAATDPAIAALMKPLLNGSFIERDPEAIVWVPLALVGLFIVRSIASFLSGIGTAWVGSRVVTDLRQEMFAKLLRLPGSFYDSTTGGSLISKFTYDATQLLGATTNVFVTLVRDSLAVIGLLGLMLYLNWRLTMIIFAVAPLIAFLAAIVSRRLRSLNTGMQRAMGLMTHTLDEAIEGERIIKIYGAQDHELRRFDQNSSKVHHVLMKVRTAGELFTPAVQVITVCALAILIYVASSGLAGGEQSVGDIVALFGAAGMLMAPLKRLTRVNESLQAGVAAAQSLFQLIDRDEEPDQGKHLLENIRGEIEFDRVSFHYQQADHPALRDIHLKIDAGQTVAVVGPSGSGKSTLIKLIARLYETEQGHIRIDGQDIRSLALDNLRSSLAYVGQETILFNDTVAANIAYGIKGASRERILAAAAKAHATEFIARLPSGFDTLIGEDGVQLSGGQRQRLSVARALLRDAPILLLDEATSALDGESERHVLMALEAAVEGRTAIIIAHRPSTYMMADRIVVLSDGRIASIGTHEDLIQTSPVYQSIHQAQQM